MAFDFSKFGRDCAKDSASDSNTLGNHLNVAYQEFLKEEKLDINGIKQRISDLQQDVVKTQNAVNNHNASLLTLENTKDTIRKDIKDLEDQKNNLANEDVKASSSDLLILVISAFITICVTLYLFVFYSSIGYGAFFGLDPNQCTIFDFNVFSKALNKGGFVLSIILLFPMIFLGLGFLVFDALKEKKYGIISVMVFFTLLVDCLIGYKITKTLYYNNCEHVDELIPWEFNMILSDPNFWFVIVSGFAAYILWGALLHSTLSKLSEIEPSKIIAQKIDQIDLQIDKENDNFATNDKNINDVKALIASNINNISDLNSRITQYQNGVSIPINVQKLKSEIGSFMGGWIAYTSLMLPEVASIKNEDAQKISDLWLKTTIQNLV